MTTRPHHDPRAIAIDARRILDAARSDAHDPAFKKYVSKGDLDDVEAHITSLESGDGARSVRLTSQVQAGVHTAKTRAALAAVLIDIRDDAKIQFPNDITIQHVFGVGTTIPLDSTAIVRHVADSMIQAAHSHKVEAAVVGLDTKALHKLEDLIHALDGADLAHVHAVTSRHTTTTTTDSLAHLVSADVAHLRLIARRAYRGDETKLAAYDRTLPRYEVVPRKPVATTPAATSAVTPTTATTAAAK